MTFSPLFAFIFAALYAVALERINPRQDHTWISVVVGVALCLAAAAIPALSNAALWPGLISTGLAFIGGGAPIIIWQLRRSLAWRDQVIERTRKRYGNSTRVADESKAGDSRDPQSGEGH